MKSSVTLSFILLMRLHSRVLRHSNRSRRRHHHRQRLQLQDRIRSDRMVAWFHLNQKAPERTKMQRRTITISPNIRRTPHKRRPPHKLPIMHSATRTSTRNPPRSHHHRTRDLRTPATHLSRRNNLILSSSTSLLHCIQLSILGSPIKVLPVN